MMTPCVSQKMDRGGWVPIITDINATVHRKCSKCTAGWCKQSACVDTFIAFFAPRNRDQVMKLRNLLQVFKRLEQ